MKKSVKVFSLFLIGIFLMMFVGGVNGLIETLQGGNELSQTFITSCGYDLKNPGYYKLAPVSIGDPSSDVNYITPTQLPQGYSQINIREPCLKISGSGITLNLNGYQIIDSFDEYNPSFIEDKNRNAITVTGKNIHIVDINGNDRNDYPSLNKLSIIKGFANGIYIDSDSSSIISGIVLENFSLAQNIRGIHLGHCSDVILRNITSSENFYTGINVEYSSNLFFELVQTYSNGPIPDYTSFSNYPKDGSGISLTSSNNNNFKHIKAINNKKGIFLSNSKNNKFNDNIFYEVSNSNSNIENDVVLKESSTNNNFLNCTFSTKSYSEDSTSKLIKKWYLDAYFSKGPGQWLNDFNVKIYDSNNNLVSSLLTDSYGYIQNEIIESTNPYKMKLSKAGFSDSDFSFTSIKLNDVSQALPTTFSDGYSFNMDRNNRIDISISSTKDTSQSFISLNSNLFATKDIGKTYYNTTSIKLNVSADRELALTNPCTVKLYLDKDYNGNYADSEIISSATGDSMIRSTNKKIEATLAKILTSGNYQAKFSCSSTATSTTVATTGELTVDFTINVPLSLQLTSPAKDKFVGGKYIGGKYSGTYPMDSINLAVSGNNNLKECFTDFNKTDKIKTCPAVESETESSESETEESEETEPCYEYEPIESVPMASVSGDLNKMSATYSPFAAGNYIINITCTDTYNAGTDEEEIKRHINNSISFKLESSPQAGGGLSVSSPKSSSEAVYAGKQNLLFKLNANENINACNVSWDNFVKINRTMIEGIVNTVPNNIFSYTSNSSDIFSDGSYTANFSCSVGANNKIESVTINFKIDSIPDLIINFPEDEETYENPEFEFDVSLDSENYIPPFVLDSCIFSIDEGVTNYTMDYINNVNQNFTLDITSDGDYTAIFWCDYSSDPFVSSLAGTITREIEFELDRTSIGTPSSFSALAISSDKIGLSWKDNSFTEQGFKIERKISGGTYSEITNVSANSALYTDTGLDSNTTYFYKIRAYNMSMTDSFYSGYSNEINANTFAEAVSANAGEDTTPAPQCGENNLNLCISKSNCENADGYWYNSACHEEAQQTQTSSSKAGEGKAGFLSGILATTGSTLFYVQIGVGIVILIILIFLIVKFFGKKKPQQMPQHHAAQINPVQK